MLKFLLSVKEYVLVCPVLNLCMLRFLFVIKNKFLFLGYDVNSNAPTPIPSQTFGRNSFVYIEGVVLGIMWCGEIL